jgi:hypothetical protein
MFPSADKLVGPPFELQTLNICTTEAEIGFQQKDHLVMISQNL